MDWPRRGCAVYSHAITGDVNAEAGNDGLDYAGMVDYAQTKGGTALRAMSFHQRADMLKKLAAYLNDHKEILYEISYAAGATAIHRETCNCKLLCDRSLCATDE